MESDWKKYLVIGLIVGVPLVALQIFLNTKYSGGKPAEQEVKEPGPVTNVVETPPPAPTYRYKKPSSNPNFGRPIEHAGAVIGDALPIKGVKFARTGILVDLDTRKVLWEKNPQQAVPIASMTKMMTLLVAMELLEKNPQITMETPVQGTAGAMKIGGAQIWIDPRCQLPLGDLLKSVAIKSANDAAYLTAEFLAGGDISAFVGQMNARAAELAMPNTRFVNPYGLPDANRNDSLSSAEGMVLLGERILEYPTLMQWAGTQMDFVMVGGKKVELANHNKLIRPQWPGVDGLKTGYTATSGYCVTVSCLRNGRRLMACVTGFPTADKKTEDSRDPFARKLIDWGYQQLAAPAAVQGTLNQPGRAPVGPVPKTPTEDSRRVRR